MTDLYLPAACQLTDSLENERETLNHPLDMLITNNGLLNMLIDAHANISYTVLKSVTHPIPQDVVGIHISNHAKQILIEKVGLKGLDTEQLRSEVMALLEYMPPQEFRVEIESEFIRYGAPSAISHLITMKHKHALGAINEAYRLLTVGLIGALTDDEWLSSMGVDAIDEQTRNHEPILLKTKDRTYRLKSIKRVRHAIVLEDT